MRLYHERSEFCSGSLSGRDEEECFTAVGRRMGIWLTTEVLTGPSVISATLAPSQVAPYEVTADDAAHRVFVVPAAVAAGWRFA